MKILRPLGTNVVVRPERKKTMIEVLSKNKVDEGTFFYVESVGEGCTFKGLEPGTQIVVNPMLGAQFVVWDENSANKDKEDKEDRIIIPQAAILAIVDEVSGGK